MSWSVGGSGKPSEVADSIDKQFAGSSPLMEPEETVRQAARKVIAVALAGCTDNNDRTVSAWGSMSTNYETRKQNNTLSITIT
jgi:hypothetical protein